MFFYDGGIEGGSDIFYRLDGYIFINYIPIDDVDKNDKNRSYIFDLLNGSIYLPLDDEGKELYAGILYKIFCSKRENHPGRAKLI